MLLNSYAEEEEDEDEDEDEEKRNKKVSEEAIHEIKECSRLLVDCNSMDSRYVHCTIKLKQPSFPSSTLVRSSSYLMSLFLK